MVSEKRGKMLNPSLTRKRDGGGRLKLGKRVHVRWRGGRALTFGTTRNILPVSATKEDAFAMHHYPE